jgi:hypothetical protein
VNIEVHIGAYQICCAYKNLSKHNLA